MKLTIGRRRRTEQILQEAERIGMTQRDRYLLGLLLNAGGELGDCRAMHYYLYLPDQDKARLAAADARRSQFQTELRMPLSEYPDDWPIIATRERCVIDLEVIRCNSAFFAATAEKYGGTYDGWQCQS